jgi:hypothetical protein
VPRPQAPFGRGLFVVVLVALPGALGVEVMLVHGQSPFVCS